MPNKTLPWHDTAIGRIKHHENEAWDRVNTVAEHRFPEVDSLTMRQLKECAAEAFKTARPEETELRWCLSIIMLGAAHNIFGEENPHTPHTTVPVKLTDWND
jgi:hypothetical protein